MNPLGWLRVRQRDDVDHDESRNRYDSPQFYRRCGRSGVRLPLISLGLWHNFGSKDSYENARDIACRAFDLGITHFDLANNYGPPDGSAEETFGRILREDLGQWRDVQNEGVRPLVHRRGRTDERARDLAGC